MPIQVLFKITIKDSNLKEAVASELNNLSLSSTNFHLLPYSIKKLDKEDPDPKHINCISIFPNTDATTAIALVAGQMNSLLSLIHGIKQISILHASLREDAEDFSTKTKSAQSRAIFIIHGRDAAGASRLKILLRKKWNLNGIILKDEPGSGKTIIEKFEREAKKAIYAFAILTPDDTIKYLSHRYKQARPNVFFELGWFHGYIGRDKVCILFKEGGQIHSDLEGMYLIKFKQDISEKIFDIEQELRSAEIIQ